MKLAHNLAVLSVVLGMSIQADDGIARCFDTHPNIRMIHREETDDFVFLRADGEKIHDGSFVIAEPFYRHGYAFVEGYWVDLQFKPYVKAYIFDNGPDPLVERRHRFWENGRVGFLDECMNKVIPAQYDLATSFSDGRAKVCKGCTPMADGEHKKLPLMSMIEIDVNGKLVQ